MFLKVADSESIVQTSRGIYRSRPRDLSLPSASTNLCGHGKSGFEMYDVEVISNPIDRPPTHSRWLILADDRTGAADCASAFASRGLSTVVAWSGERSRDIPHADVVAYDARTRELDAAAAIATQRHVLERFAGSGGRLYKKIDSTLRGHPAAEIRATLDWLKETTGRAFAVLAPAFPATGRTTFNAHLYLNGESLERSELWRHDRTYENANLLDMLASSRVSAMHIPLQTVEAGALVLRTQLEQCGKHSDCVVVCDAVTQADLESIALAASATEALLIGSAGLAHALASQVALRPKEALRFSRSFQGTLVVVGSLAQQSRSAARVLAESGEARHVRIDAHSLLDGHALNIGPIVSALDAGTDVLLELMARERPDPSMVTVLVDRLGGVLSSVGSHIGALVATGGETAAAMLDHLRVHAMRLVGEIEPGIVLGVSQGERTIPVVTKAGAFGDEGTLLRIARRLRRIKTTGLVE